MDLLIPPGPGIPHGLTIPGDQLAERFSRAQGPGGQSVNTADSRVELELDLRVCPAFTDAQRVRLLEALDGRLVGDRLVVTASEHRSQRRNRVAARDRMGRLLRAALAPPPPPRRATRPTLAAKRRRLEAKRARSLTKAARARPGATD
ncbi:alternative ribosome rescue aminoacyl-tRNA hydrolase ArfB [Nostocoides vanveenii]|uniref:Alternative ribosome rescue aminoacyl-tRNA hydrolase ArfB n=1 Tax=Nostocoides vanveenii TaxID=330835 RepID=A0ABN2KX99_9MICO